MSRKLIYASGLLACYCCHVDYDEKQRADKVALNTLRAGTHIAT